MRMAALEVQYRRTHNLLLINRILSCRDQISPFTLVLDSLHQSGWMLVKEMMARAKVYKINIIFVSFETLRRPAAADVFLRSHGKSHDIVQKDIVSNLQSDKRNLVVFDTLHALLSQTTFNTTSFLSSFTAPTTSVVAIYHTSVPLAPSASTASATVAYAPLPLALLRYLATAIITVHSLKHILAKKKALDRSEAPPLHGLEEGIEGAIVALGSNDQMGSVVEMEHRRRSGRSVLEWFYVPHPLSPSSDSSKEDKKQQVVLLEDHPEYPRVTQSSTSVGEIGVSTFELGLSEEQRRDRDKVVLPYFDAQSESGVGQGGRILYDLGVEDDFDEEEDEI